MTQELIEKLALAADQAAEASGLELHAWDTEIDENGVSRPPTAEELQLYYQALAKCLVGEGLLSLEQLDKEH